MNKELIMQLLQLAMQKEEVNQKEDNNEIRIAVLQRGWVCIGRYSENGDKCRLDDAYVIRRWGTDEGLGQLANDGKQSETKLEKTGVIEWEKLTGIFTIICNKEKWENEL